MIKRQNNESGEVMLESTIIISITLMVLIAMLGLGYVICQQAITYTIACDVATAVADSYKYTSVTDLSEFDISEDAVTSSKMYRYIFSESSIEDTNKDKAKEYAEKRAKFVIAKPEQVEIKKIEFVGDGIGRRHVEVTVSIKTKPLFFGTLASQGMGFSKEFTASANAECLDFTSYSGQLGLVTYLQNKLADTNTGKIVDHSAGIYQNVKEIITKVKGLISGAF